MKIDEPRRTTKLQAHGPDGADSAQIAETVVSTWHAIDSALTPIIGPRGTQALFNRSLQLTARTHAWLAMPREGSRSDLDVAALKDLFAEQPRTAAADAASLLMRTFHALLGTLIGPSLAERLLRPVATGLSSDPFAQEPSP